MHFARGLNQNHTHIHRYLFTAQNGIATREYGTLKAYHLLDAFQMLYSNKSPFCQSQTYHLLGFNQQQPLWDSY